MTPCVFRLITQIEDPGHQGGVGPKGELRVAGCARTLESWGGSRIKNPDKLGHFGFEAGSFRPKIRTFKAKNVPWPEQNPDMGWRSLARGQLRIRTALWQKKTLTSSTVVKVFMDYFVHEV